MREVRCIECGEAFETDAARVHFCSLRCRLDASVQKGAPDECWPWTKFTARGYGKITTYDREAQKWVTQRAHRVAFEQYIGPISDGMIVMHRCDNPKCCNPHHLTLGTQPDNLTDMAKKGRGGRKIDAETAIQIRNDPRSSRLVASSFGVSPSLVKQIKAGTIWAGI